MTITEQRKVYSDWSGGHWGSTGPFKAPDNQYRSVNLQRYANGTLGPRPGWKLLETTGSAPAPTAGSGSEFYGMCWAPGISDGGYLIFVSYADSSETKRLDMDTLAWASSNLGAPSADMMLDVPGGGNIFSHVANWVIVGGRKFYDAATNTLSTTVTWPASFAPKAGCVYKARMYVYGDGTYPGRVYYSSAGDYTVTSADDYFDVGHPSYTTIIGMWDVRDTLVILSVQGATNLQQAYADWWVLQGANPQSGTLRRIARTQWPYVPAYVGQFNDVLIWQDTLYDHGISLHDGTSLDNQALSRLVSRSGSDTVGAATRSFGAAVTLGEPAVILPHRNSLSGYTDPTATVIGDHFENGLAAWELVNGTWTKASWWNGATEEVVDNDVPFLWQVIPWESDKLIACTNPSSDGSGEFKFYTRNVTLSRPSTPSDVASDPDEPHTDIASAGAGLDCRLWLTPVTAPDGAGVRIRRVVVDFDYWSNASFFPDGCSIKAKRVNYRHSRGQTMTDAQEQVADFSVFADSESVLPSRGRVVLNFPDSPWFSASQVYFTELRNVAIDSVTVHFQQNTTDPQ